MKNDYFFKKQLIKKYKRGEIFKNLSFDDFLNKIEEMTYTRFFNKKYSSFPTGLLSLLLSFLDREKILYKIKDLRQIPNTKRVYRKINKPPTLRYYQQEIVDECIKNHRGIIEAATGSGKTNCILELVYQLKNNILIVVPSSTILVQFYNILIKTFGKKHIGLITGNKKQLNSSITIATYQSLSNIDKKFFDKIDTLIIDEAHHSACESLIELNKKCFNNIYHRYYFTGTAYRNDGKDMDLQSVVSDQFLYKYPVQQGIDDNYLVPIKFIVYKYSHQFSGGNWRKELTDCIVNNLEYNKMIIDKAKRLNEKNIGTIIFVDQINHGKFLEKNIPGAVFVNGTEERAINMESIDDFNKGKFNILIGTSVIGEGVDTVRARCGIMAGGGKAESTIVQRIGRLLRPFPNKNHSMMIDFTHNNTKYLQEHFIERHNIYKTFGEDKIQFKSL